MSPQQNDLCICLDDDWTDLAYYIVRSVSPQMIEVSLSHDIMHREVPRRFTGKIDKHVFLSPFTLRTWKTQSERAAAAEAVNDLASNLLRARVRLPVDSLLAEIAADARLKDVSAAFIEGCVRCSVASGGFVAARRGKKAKVLQIELSAEQQQRETYRTLAGTLASELTQLSQRIRLLVQHGPTVGTYRENLLQALLRKHLPERYHVATGFIDRCARQLDIVIYDRIDYAPVFREGDLVVVHRESVRAVIEVKTSLDPKGLKDSLQLLEDVGAYDDRDPPFFKGIFAFESRMSPRRLQAAVADFYITDEHAPIDLDAEHSIGQPFDHLTTLCVLEKFYAEIDYQPMDDAQGRLVPSLFSYTSATGLKPQATHFLDKLLAYLRTDGLKAHHGRAMTRSLGMDTQVTKFIELTGASWGGYFSDDEDLGEGDEGAEMEARIRAVREWLAGGGYRRD